MGEQEREEEEEDREEARRIDAELAQRLEGAFDDLDFDDDDDSSLCSPPGGFNHVVNKCECELKSQEHQLGLA